MRWLRRRKRNDAPTKATAALDKLVREGVILGFETNFDSHKDGEHYRVRVIVDPGNYLRQERLWLQVRQALEPLGSGVEITMERLVSDSSP